MNTRANTLKAIRHEPPDFVPVFDGTVWEAFELGGNFRWTSFTDHWGVRWQAEISGYVPVDVTHPLADLKKIERVFDAVYSHRKKAAKEVMVPLEQFA